MLKKISLLVLACLLAFLLAGCAAAAPAKPAEQFAIYLPVAQMSGLEILKADLSEVMLQAQPLIAADEILSYDPATHDLRLSRDGMQHLADLNVPMNGTAFVACVGKKPIFAGAVWTMLSSQSFEGVTIQVPIVVSDTLVHLYSGYPSFDDPLPNDPREDPRLLQALEQAGKLR